jgi:hypothetical protein
MQMQATRTSRGGSGWSTPAGARCTQVVQNNIKDGQALVMLLLTLKHDGTWVAQWDNNRKGRHAVDGGYTLRWGVCVRRR